MARAGPHGSRRRYAPPHHEGLTLATVLNINPTPNNRRLSSRSSPCCAAFSRYLSIRKCRDPHRARATMDMNRLHLIGGSAAGVAGALAMSPEPARAAPLTSTLGRNVTQYGVRPGSPDDQTAKLQRAIDEAARAQVPLALPPGVYRTAMLRLWNGSQLVGRRGATKLAFSGGASLLQGEGANSVGLTGITFDG